MTALGGKGVRVDVVDTVGAGDTFAAAVLVSLWNLGVRDDPAALDRLDRGDWTAVLHWAASAAAITCTRRGADPPTAAELPPVPA